MSSDTTGRNKGKNTGERFYGRRTGKPLRPGRRRLIDEMLPGLRADPAAFTTLDDLFGARKRAYWLEIGFGGGEHLAHMAANNPDVGIVGCEPFVNGVAGLLSHIDERRLTNVRIWDDDARDLLPVLPDAAFERLFLLHPDPWPKTRHHRRRFINTENLDTIARLLIDGGAFRFAHDHMDYIRWTLAHTNAFDKLVWTAESPADWRERPVDAIRTRYEAKARRKGAAIVYLNYRRASR